MALEILRARGCERDLAAILDQLVEGYRALGDTTAEALARGAARVRAIEAAMTGLGRTAFLARPRNDVLPGLRQLATERAVFSFVVDADAGQVLVLAIFLAPLSAGPDLRAQLTARMR
jgi:toxin ParE1/3/4